MSKKNSTKTLDQFIDEQYGAKGTANRDRFEQGYESFKLRYLIQQARLEKRMTQEDLAEEPLKAEGERLINTAVPSFNKQATEKAVGVVFGKC